MDNQDTKLLPNSQDDDYLNLSIEDRCRHKTWKARVNGYEAATKLFEDITDGKSPEFNKYQCLIRKFVVDSNAVAQEKGLDAAFAYVKNAECAGKMCSEVVSGIVLKCLGSSKTRIKEKGQAIILMYLEIEKHELAIEEVVKGFANKTPEVVVTCVQTLREALREFGPKVVALKALIKQLPMLLSHRYKGVRDEAKLLCVEIYRCIGETLKPQLTSLNSVMLKDLETEFEKIEDSKANPVRFLRSQQQKMHVQELAMGNINEIDGNAKDEIDYGYEMQETSVNILSKLPGNFFEKCNEKKWQERKEALDVLHQLTSNSKLQPGNYGNVLRVLIRIIAKDTNVMVTVVAAKCLTGLANGLNSKFHPYVAQCVSTIFEKFKEKKQNVVLSLREAIDAVYNSTTLDAMEDDVVAALGNKNPAVRAETIAFLTRCFSRCNADILSRKLLKTLCSPLVKTLTDTDPVVRDNSADALGTAMAVVGEKLLLTYLQDVDELKIAKVKECCKKGVRSDGKVVGTSKAKNATAASTQQRKISEEITKLSQKSVKSDELNLLWEDRKILLVPNRKIASASKTKSSKPSATTSEFDEKELTCDEAEERVAMILPSEMLSGICDSNWKVRLSFMKQFLQFVKSSDKKTIPVQVLIVTLAKKPGFKDNNFQVLQLKMDVVIHLARGSFFSRCTAKFCVLELTAKLADSKSGALIGETLTVIAEATSLEFISSGVLETAFAQKNPKTHVEAMNWLANAIKEFGLQIEIKTVIENVKKAVAASNSGVRSAAVNLLGVMYLYIGNSLKTFLDFEKGAILQQIETEFEKLEGIVPPAPIRGVNAKTKLADKENDNGSHSFINEVNEISLNTIESEINFEKTKLKAGNKNCKNWPFEQIKPSTTKPGKDSSLPMQENNLKEQRLLDEQRLNVLKWDVKVSSDKLYKLLKDQITSAGFNSNLQGCMFHNDFLSHIEAIETLNNCLDSHPDATICNLDLVLKWFTLLFIDSNASVLEKGFDYQQRLFALLARMKYRLTEFEANAFIPSLIAKLSDPENQVRQSVRSILKGVTRVYPVSWMFIHVFDGLKSEKWHQQAECLDEIGYLIDSYGVHVCQPSVTAVLSEVTRHVSSSHETVCNSALKCIVQAYDQQREEIFKHLETISDESMNLVEEWIQRTARNPPPPRVNRANLSKSSSVCPTGTSLVGKKQKMAIVNSEPANQSKVTAAVDLLIAESGSHEIATAVTALERICGFLKDEDCGEVMQTLVDRLIKVGTFQLRLVQSRHMIDDTIDPREIVIRFRWLNVTLLTLFNNCGFAKRVSIDGLYDLMNVLITIVVDDRLDQIVDGSKVVENTVILINRVIEHSNKTGILNALIKLLNHGGGSENHSTKFVEFVMENIYNIMHVVPSVLEELELDKILLELHHILKVFQCTRRKEGFDELEMKMVKYILKSLVCHKGKEILNHLNVIDDLRESKLEPYLQRLLKELENCDNSKTDGTKDSSDVQYIKLVKLEDNAQIMTEIFKKLRSVAHLKEGLTELYDFKKLHPDVDLEPYMRKSSQHFKDFIDRKLQAIEADRKSNRS